MPVVPHAAPRRPRLPPVDPHGIPLPPHAASPMKHRPTPSCSSTAAQHRLAPPRAPRPRALYPEAAASILKLPPPSAARRPPFPSSRRHTHRRRRFGSGQPVLADKLLEHLLSLFPLGSTEDNCW